MIIQGEVEIAAPRAAVWDFILDPSRIASCVPGVEEVVQVDERTFTGRIKVSVGPVGGSFEFTAVIAEADPPAALEANVDGRDSMTGSAVHTHVAVRLEEPEAGRTRFVYRADVAIKGRLAIVGDMVMRATANLIFTQFSRCLGSRLEGERREA
jgi:uncharacterized protein